MKNSRKAIFPGFVLGCLILVLLGSIAAKRMPPLQTTVSQATTHMTPTRPTITATDQAPVNTPSSNKETSQTPHQAVTQEAVPHTPTPTHWLTNTAAADDTTPPHDPNCDLNPGLPPEILQWCNLIQNFAKEYELPPGLIAVVIMQESYGDPQAYSKSGAVGLMQVMPRDGLAAAFQCNGQPCFSDRPSIAELEDPAFNINYGTRMLANLFKKHGTYREALFRYGPINMGYEYADLILSLWDKYP